MRQEDGDCGAPTTPGGDRRQIARILVAGPPRSGKTTMVTRLVDLLRDEGVQVAGIVTREIRDGDQRVGFEVADLAGPRAVLARVDLDRGPTIGRYRVDVEALEQIAVPALRRADDAAGVVVVDELGPMELLSSQFIEAVDVVLTRRVPLVATVHRGGHAATDRWRALPEVRLVTLTAANRDQLPELLAGELLGSGRAAG